MLAGGVALALCVLSAAASAGGFLLKQGTLRMAEVIQAGKVTITTLSNGKQQLDGEEFHLLPAKG
jgi:hypothetical protein